MYKIVITILVVIRLLATGFREGHTQHHPPDNDLPYLDYHGWRTVDVIIFGIILGELIGYLLALSILAFGYCLIYERALQYIGFNKLFYPQNDYPIMGIKIPIRNWHMVLMGLAGLYGIITILFL